MERSQSCCVGRVKYFHFHKSLPIHTNMARFPTQHDLHAIVFFVIVKHHGQIGLVGTIGVIYVDHDAL